MQSRSIFSFVVASLAVIAGAQRLPLAAVRFFNPYQHPTSWSGWGSTIYQGGTAQVANVSGAAPVQTIAGEESIVLDSKNPSGGWWNVFFKVSGNTMNWLRIGRSPVIHLRMRWVAIPADADPDYAVKIGDASVRLKDYVTPSTSQWQDLLIPTSAFLAKQPGLDLTRTIAIVLYPQANYSGRSEIAISAMDVSPTSDLSSTDGYVKVDQLGYTPNMKEKVVLVSYPTGTYASDPSSFDVLDLSTNRVAFHGALHRATVLPDWAQHGDTVLDGDFGTLRKAGSYRVQVASIGATSQRFAIGNDVYDSLYRDSLRYFYYCRSGQSIGGSYGEGYSRQAYHADNRQASYNYDPKKGHFDFGVYTTRDVFGCWFDAGDTHIQVPSTVVACWYLLETAAQFGKRIGPKSLNLPESRVGVPDTIPLIRCGLDWLGKMQNPDGSVHHYVLGPSATDPQKVSDISSFAAALAAGAFAKAYVVLGPSMSQTDAADLLRRAKLSWAWLQTHPGPMKPRSALVDGVDPGTDDDSWGYGTNATYYDNRFRAFAAVELYAATGETSYQDYFLNLWSQNGGSAIGGSVFGTNQTGWQTDQVMDYPSPLTFAFMDYVRMRRTTDSSVNRVLRQAFLHQADLFVEYAGASGYRVPMLYPGHLFWGSSGGVVAPAGMICARAYEWTGDAKYLNVAANALHWICGRNTVGRFFATGYGDYQHGSDAYSQYWLNLLKQPPGILGGNVNVDGSANSVVTNPWKRFINTQDADMTEPGVYWNSSFAWLLGYFALGPSVKH